MTDPEKDLAKIIQESAAARRPAEVSPVDEEGPDLGGDLEEHRLRFQIQCLQQELNQLKDNHGLRHSYAGRIFWVVVCWLAGVFLCVLMTGFVLCGFKLSDAVLIAFITSTTVNVVGLFVLVAKWMFPSGQVPAEHKELLARAEGVRVSGESGGAR